MVREGLRRVLHRPKLRRTRPSGRVRVGVRPCGALKLWRPLGQWKDGGRRLSSSSPAMLLLLSQDLCPLRISVCSLYLYYVRCMWYLVV